MWRRGNAPPISEDGRQGIARLLAKALNKNQLLILEEITKEEGRSFTSRLLSLSSTFKVPASTLKLNARVLRELQLISVDDHQVSLTEAGLEALQLVHRLGRSVDKTHPLQEVN